MKIIPKKNRLYVFLDKKIDTYKVYDELLGKEIEMQISEDSAQQTRIGTVMAKGEDVKLYEVGDRVAISYWSGIYINIYPLGYRDERHKICTEEEILFEVGEEDGS